MSEPVAAIETKANWRTETALNVVKRFKLHGISGPQDMSPSGRSATYGESVGGRLVATTKIQPQQLDLPYNQCALNRLTKYLRRQ